MEVPSQIEEMELLARVIGKKEGTRRIVRKMTEDDPEKEVEIRIGVEKGVVGTNVEIEVTTRVEMKEGIKVTKKVGIEAAVVAVIEVGIGRKRGIVAAVEVEAGAEKTGRAEKRGITRVRTEVVETEVQKVAETKIEMSNARAVKMTIVVAEKRIDERDIKAAKIEMALVEIRRKVKGLVVKIENEIIAGETRKKDLRNHHVVIEIVTGESHEVLVKNDVEVEIANIIDMVIMDDMMAV